MRVSSGNPALEPDDAESFSVGAVTGTGPVSLSVDWFQIALSNVPSQLSAQSIMDLEAEGALPPGVAVIRDSRGLIDQIESPLVNSRETDLSGIDVRARIGWDAELADMVFDVRWLHVSRNETHVAESGSRATFRATAFTVRFARAGTT